MVHTYEYMGRKSWVWWIIKKKRKKMMMTT